MAQTVTSLPVGVNWRDVRKMKCVTGKNNNKYYDVYLSPEGDVYGDSGRIGSSKVIYFYPNGGQRKFDSIVKAKLHPKKGYTDVTHLSSVEVVEQKGDFAPVSDAIINGFVTALRGYTGAHVKANYRIGSEAVTQAMIDQAQSLLNLLVDIKDVQMFNNQLINLYITIPRQMGHVQDHLIKNIDEANELLEKEQATLDTMASQVALDAAQAKPKVESSPMQTALDAIGVSISHPTDDDVYKVRQLMGPDQGGIDSIYRVKNNVTESRMRKWMTRQKHKDTTLLWHGSKNPNWWPILDVGLLIRPTASNGRAFGNGLYFANQASKSLGYVSYGTAHLALFEVHTGNAYKLRERTRSQWYRKCDYEWLQNKGEHDALHAVAGGSFLRNDEIIVYRNAQATIKYLVKIRR